MTRSRATHPFRAIREKLFGPVIDDLPPMTAVDALHYLKWKPAGIIPSLAKRVRCWKQQWVLRNELKTLRKFRRGGFTQETVTVGQHTTKVPAVTAAELISVEMYVREARSKVDSLPYKMVQKFGDTTREVINYHPRWITLTDEYLQQLDEIIAAMEGVYL